MALASPNKFHGAVESCFGSREDRKLWRIDQLNGEHYLMIVSPEKPKLTSIKSQFGYPKEPDEIKSYEALLDRIEEGSVWQFRLTANPTHSVKREGEQRGKVVAHISEKYQMEWLYKKAEQNGFSVLSEGSCIISSNWKSFYKKNGSGKVKLQETTYQGILKVENTDLFRRALSGGIGRAKSYGMGLLTVMRL